VKGSEEEEEDLLEALEELSGAVERRAKAWKLFEESTHLEIVEGKRIRTDKKQWERAQGRL
jgi:hypothetical protein